jgi:hypothetical protein
MNIHWIGKPIGFCSMTFMVNGIEIGGITCSLQASLKSAKKKPNLNIRNWTLNKYRYQLWFMMYQYSCVCK